MYHRTVSFALDDFAGHAIDFVQSSHVVEKDGVRCVSDVISIAFVAPPHVQMDVSFPSVVGCVGIGELCKKWAWIFGQRMEVNRMSCFTDNIQKSEQQRYDNEIG